MNLTLVVGTFNAYFSERAVLEQFNVGTVGGLEYEDSTKMFYGYRKTKGLLQLTCLVQGINVEIRNCPTCSSSNEATLNVNSLVQYSLES